MLKKVTKMWVTNCKITIAQLRTTLNISMNYKQLFYQLIKLAKFSHGNLEKQQIK